MKKMLAATLLLCLLSAGKAFSYSETHDEYTLELKGFSQEMFQPIEAQVSRMEGRYPPEMPSKSRKFFQNLMNNEWIEPLEPFGSDRVDPPRLPKHL